MTEPPFLYEKHGAIAYLIFNRPRARNALNPEMFCRLADALQDYADDDSLRVAIVTGSGDKAFTAGADLNLTIPLFSNAREPETEWDHRLVSNERDIRNKTALRNFLLYKPVIAAINGACIGAGTEMIQGMDIRIAVEHATFSLTEASLGFMPGGGSTVRLPRQIPYCRAMEMLLLGEQLSAQEALHFGFVNKIVTAEDLMPYVQMIANKIAQKSPFALRKIKETVLRSSGIALQAAYDIEEQNYFQVIASNDAKEGPLAFSERRPPKFTGT